MIQALKSQICQSQGVQNYEIDSQTFQILCEKGPGNELWLVMLNRFEGGVDFYTNRTFNQYANNGVGNVDTDFFVSLEFLHKVTNKFSHETQLLVTMEEASKKTWAYYSNFSVGDASSKYVLSVSGYWSQSTAGDSLSYHSGMKFSTPDQDNEHDCSNKYQGAFWYNYCLYANPLGEYGNDSLYLGIIWEHFYGKYISLDKMKFMIRPKQSSQSKLCLKNSSKLITCIGCSSSQAKQINGVGGLCVLVCSQYAQNYFLQAQVCYECHSNCQSCSGLQNYNCIKCAASKKEDDSSIQKDPKHCIDSCPVETYQNDSNTCLACHSNCKSCSGPYNYNCNDCADGMKDYLTSPIKDIKHCVEKCPEGTYQNDQGLCLPCHSNCQSCSGPQNYNCLKCAASKKEDDSSIQKDPKHCIDSCPEETYQNDSNTCLACNSNCKTCSGPQNYNCNECAEGKKDDFTSILKNKKHCVEKCPEGTYQNEQGHCLQCHSNCQSCSGPQNFNCLQCTSGLKQDLTSIKKKPLQCVESCPFGSLQNINKQCQGNIFKNFELFLISSSLYLQLNYKIKRAALLSMN